MIEVSHGNSSPRYRSLIKNKKALKLLRALLIRLSVMCPYSFVYSASITSSPEFEFDESDEELAEPASA